MGDSFSKIVSGIVEDLVIGAINDSGLRKVGEAVSFHGSKNSSGKGDKGKALKGKGRPSSGGMVYGAKFADGDGKVNGRKGEKATAVERIDGDGKVVG